jgi:hypothetical protein
MAQIEEFLQKELLNRMKLVEPSVEYAPHESYYRKELKTHEFSDSCGCYSEWTTEACSLDIWVDYDKDLNRAEEFKLSRSLNEAADHWAQKNLSWSGCECCNEELYVSVHLFKRKQNEETIQ